MDNFNLPLILIIKGIRQTINRFCHLPMLDILANIALMRVLPSTKALVSVLVNPIKRFYFFIKPLQTTITKTNH